jgi:hypothetical protein
LDDPRRREHDADQPGQAIPTLHSKAGCQDIECTRCDARARDTDRVERAGPREHLRCEATRDESPTSDICPHPTRDGICQNTVSIEAT